MVHDPRFSGPGWFRVIDKLVPYLREGLGDVQGLWVLMLHFSSITWLVEDSVSM